MAQGKGRWIRAVLGIVFAVFGLGCLNYTQGFGIDHHRNEARKHGFPEPSYAIFILGAVLAPLGAGLVGHSIRG